MNRHRFRNHFQVFPASISQAYGYFGIIQNSRWRQVALIVEDEFLFTSVRKSVFYIGIPLKGL